MIDLLPALLPVALPACFLLGAAFSRSRHRWPAAQAASLAALFLSLATAAVVLAGAADGGPAAAGLVMAVLVGFLGFVLVRYSRHYMDADAGEGRYATLLQVTLAAVAVVVLADHLLLLLGAWIGISLCLHGLLQFYPDRPRAALAAHKKFLAARLAESLLLVAVLLLYSHHGTWRISDIVAAYPVAVLSASEQWAAALLAAAALIKCAQLPMHGWLIQVVEAPTPVSALLHAGIVNLGGFLLILFAPLLVQATAAQWLLLVVAGLTTVVAALVMATRISIKVRLAWSTSAQMGLMLVECALGLFELALLHLTAHACYKAYGFLAAGGAVERHLQRRLAPAAAPTGAAWVAAAAIGLPIALGTGVLVAGHGPFSPWLLLGAALTVVLAERGSVLTKRPIAAALGVALALCAAYVVQKLGAGTLVAAVPTSAGWPADAWVALLIIGLTVTHVMLRLRPGGVPTRRLSAWLFAGLYLDEWMTRTTLRLWPIALPETPATTRFRLLTKEH